MSTEPRFPQSDPADRAAARFQAGYNCAQAVLWSVAEACDLPRADCIPGVALAMGGGLGHTGQVCGALTGGVLAIGLACDVRLEGSLVERRTRANQVAATLVDAFSAEFASPDCAAILGFSWREPGAPERFEAEGAKAAKCTPAVRWAVAETCRLIAGL